jgi:hypothetical protein
MVKSWRAFHWSLPTTWKMRALRMVPREVDPAKTADSARVRVLASIRLFGHAKCKTQSVQYLVQRTIMYLISPIYSYAEDDPAEPRRRGYFSVFMPECDWPDTKGKRFSWL